MGLDPEIGRRHLEALRNPGSVGFRGARDGASEPERVNLRRSQFHGPTLYCAYLGILGQFFGPSCLRVQVRRRVGMWLECEGRVDSGT